MNVEFLSQSVECLTPESFFKEYPRLIEEYARICFQSDMKEGQNKAFVKRLLVNQHESVLEHFHLSFKIVTDRAMANALVRHRHCAFTQESTHYIPYGSKDCMKVISYEDNYDSRWDHAMKDILNIYEIIYKSNGKDMSRGLLPLGLKTELRMTTNLREWRHIIRLRGAFDHPQMLHLIRKLHKWFQLNLPLFVEDIDVK